MAQRLGLGKAMLVLALFLLAACAADIDQRRVSELRMLPQSHAREIVARLLDPEWAASPFLFHAGGLACDATTRVPIQFIQINRVTYDSLLGRLYIFGENFYASRCSALMAGRVVRLTPAEFNELSAALVALGARLR